jgi:hypothetical protein
VAGYALAARAMIAQGLSLPEYERWTDQLVVRHVHALSPSQRGTFAGGDTQSTTPSIAPSPWTLASVIAGPSSDAAASWARAELVRLNLKGDNASFLIFEALADARGVPATEFPRETSSTFHLSRGNGALFARSSWSRSATWMAMQCTRTIDVDHLPANAGNFVLTRGADEVVVDPSPYGSLSSLTSNAPTVDSAQLPADYRPSQAYWSEKTGYRWARQTASAIVAARCDYADQPNQVRTLYHAEMRLHTHRRLLIHAQRLANHCAINAHEKFTRHVAHCAQAGHGEGTPAHNLVHVAL